MLFGVRFISDRATEQRNRDSLGFLLRDTLVVGDHVSVRHDVTRLETFHPHPRWSAATRERDVSLPLLEGRSESNADGVEGLALRLVAVGGEGQR